MRVQVPVYPPSSPFRFHLQLKSLLVPPCAARSLGVVSRPQQRGCCLSPSFFPPFSLVSRVFLFRATALLPLLVLSREASSQESCCARGIVVVVVVVVASSSVSVRRSTMQAESQFVCVRSRRVRVKVYRGSPAASTPPLLLYRCTFYIARDGQLEETVPSAPPLLPLLLRENAGLPHISTQPRRDRISISRLGFER